MIFSNNGGFSFKKTEVKRKNVFDKVNTFSTTILYAVEF